MSLTTTASPFLDCSLAVKLVVVSTVLTVWVAALFCQYPSLPYFACVLTFSSGCVVFGRVAGDSASAFVLQQASSQDKASGRLGAVAGHLLETTVRIDPSASKVNLEFSWSGANKSASSPAPSSSSSSPSPKSESAPKPEQAEQKSEKKAEESPAKSGGFTAADVAKHNTKDDCWVIVDGKVLDLTKVSSHIRKRATRASAVVASSCSIAVDVGEFWIAIHGPPS